MALLQKILPNRKGSLSAFERWTSTDSSKEWRTPKYDPSQIRLVIYVDNERDRKLWLDSKAVKRLEECQVRSKCTFKRAGKGRTSEKESGCRAPMFHFSHPGSDVPMLEEIMFGSVGIAYTGSALKVHLTKSPPQLMLTKVFVPEAPKRESMGSELDSDSYSFNSHSDPSDARQISTPDKNSAVAQSVPMDVPSPNHTKRASFDIIDEDSGLASLTSSGSFHTPFPSPSSNGSYNSLQRRKNRILYTSLESGLKKRNSQDNLLVHESGPSSISSTSSTSSTKKPKIALGILFGLSDDKKDDESNRLFENFFFSHITLLEGHLEKLRAGIEKAYYNRRNFYPIAMESLDIFRSDVEDLYTTPRLSEPVWLNMMSYSNYRYSMSEKFMKQFMNLVSKFDNKNTNFFISTLVTAVLTHHLAWVPTVTPAGGTSIRTYLHNHSPNWVDAFAKTHPYNPLWAQLGDLYGAIGFPLKLARTVVVGKKADLVNRILYILTYFIRCSDVNENDELGSLKSCLDDLNFENDKQDITPIKENVGLNKFMPVVSQKINVNSEGKVDLSRQGSVISMGNMSSFSSASCSSQKTVLDWDILKNEKCDRTYSVRKFVESNQSESHYVQPEQETHHYDQGDFFNSDEGYCSIVPVEGKEPAKDENSVAFRPCRLSATEIIESTPREYIKNVTKAVTGDCKTVEVSSSPPETRRKVSTNSLSKLSQNLADYSLSTKNSKSDNSQISASELRERYTKEGSHSIFDEYFCDNNIETKTIDQIDIKDRVIQHPLAKCESIKSSTDSIIRELAGSVSSQCSEQQATHDPCYSTVGGSFRPRISSLSRQLSSERGLTSRPTTLYPGRCRSVTPTELSRRRHLSSTSSFDLENPLLGYRELDMPIFMGDANSSNIKAFDRNFGRSLLAGYSDHYLSDFVLHGTSDTKFKEKLRKDLQVSVQHSVLDEPIGEAVCVIADTDNWSVDIASSRYLDKPSISQPVIYSQLVCNLIEAVQQLWKLKMSPEFCLMHLEDRLQEIFFKSKMLAEYLKDVKKCNMKELSQLLGFEPGDLPLLVSIAGTHSPHLSLGVV